MEAIDAKFKIAEKIVCWTDDDSKKRHELVNLLKELHEYKKMWEELDNFIMKANHPYSMANEMKNIKRKHFPLKEEK